MSFDFENLPVEECNSCGVKVSYPDLWCSSCRSSLYGNKNVSSSVINTPSNKIKALDPLVAAPCVKQNPVKCNGVSHNGMSKHSIVIDWLSVHYFFDSEFAPSFDELGIYSTGNVVLKLLNYNTRHFRTVCEVSVFGNMLGVLAYDPLSIQSYCENSCSFKVDNRVFYDGSWRRCLRELESALNLEFRNITRLDIALDTKNDSLLNLVHTYFHSSTNGQFEDIKYLGRSAIEGFASKVGKTTVYNYKIGVPVSPKSKITKVLTIYNKTRHLLKVPKPYISDFHSVNLEDNSLDVYRYELRMQSKALNKLSFTSVCPDTGEVKEYRQLTLDHLEDFNVLKQVYNFQMKRFVEFTTHSGVKNVTNRPRISNFPFDISTDLIEFVRLKRQNRSSDRTAKIAVKFLLNEHFTSEFDHVYDLSVCCTVADLLNSYSLWDWFFDKFEIWTFDFDVHFSFYKNLNGKSYSKFIQIMKNLRK